MSDELRESLQILINKFDYNTVAKTLKEIKPQGIDKRTERNRLHWEASIETMVKVLYLRKQGKTFTEIASTVCLSSSRCSQLHGKLSRILRHPGNKDKQIKVDQILSRLESESYGS